MVLAVSASVSSGGACSLFRRKTDRSDPIIQAFVFIEIDLVSTVVGVRNKKGSRLGWRCKRFGFYSG